MVAPRDLSPALRILRLLVSTHGSATQQKAATVVPGARRTAEQLARLCVALR